MTHERPRFRDRPTGEILILTVTFTVCFGVFASGLTIVLLTVFRPEIDVSIWISRVTGLLNTMLGVMAGFLAGRTDRITPRNNDVPPE